MGEPSPQRCLYQILGVERDCSLEEIRSSYKRLALQLHPDKLAQSGGGGIDATSAFQELLNAYEILSNPKERALYDSLRSQVLFVDPSHASKSRPSSFDLDLFSFFSQSAFSGFSNSGKGFFKIYGDVFGKIYAQEIYFTDRLGFPSHTIPPAPLIGDLESPYAQVTAFYSYWLGFRTVMNFSWVDECDSSAGQNRRWRRLMEEDNHKARKKARKEYNDMVRGLAAFVKKRDKRVCDMQMKKKLEEDKRREDEKQRKKEEVRKKQEKAMMYEEPEWTKIEFSEDKFMWADQDEEDMKKKNKKGKVAEAFCCVVCNKKFKSDKQWKNHVQSKKHKDKVLELQIVAQEEDEALRDVCEKGINASFCSPYLKEDDYDGDHDIPIHTNDVVRLIEVPFSIEGVLEGNSSVLTVCKDQKFKKQHLSNVLILAKRNPIAAKKSKKQMKRKILQSGLFILSTILLLLYALLLEFGSPPLPWLKNAA